MEKNNMQKIKLYDYKQNKIIKELWKSIQI